MRIALVTSSPHGGAGAALPALATAPGVELACVILSREEGYNRNARFKRKLRKAWKIGVGGALNGLRLRKWFTHHGGLDVRETAAAHGVTVIEVPQVNAPETVEALKAYRIELGVSLGNGYIRRNVFETPAEGFINYHGELLPEFPGGQSIIWPIRFGQTKTGFSIHRIDRGIDTGEILMRREFDIAFRPTLRETVAATGAIIHPQMPIAIAEVVSRWREVKAKKLPNNATRSFTTPTLREYLAMEWHNRRLYRAQQRKAQG